MRTDKNEQLTLLSQRRLAFTEEICSGSVNSEGHLKKSKTRRNAYLGIHIYVIKSPIHLVRQSLSTVLLRNVSCSYRNIRRREVQTVPVHGSATTQVPAEE